MMYEYECRQGAIARKEWEELCARYPRTSFEMPANPYSNGNPSNEEAWFEGWNHSSKKQI